MFKSHVYIYINKTMHVIWLEVILNKVTKVMSFDF